MSNIYANNINPRSGDTVTFPQNIKVLGTATYEDVANVDSVGIITARAGVNVTGGTVTVGADPNDGVNAGTKMTGTGLVQATRSSGASAVFMGYTQNNSAPRFRINGSGSGFMLGDIGIGTDNTNAPLQVNNGLFGLEFNPNSENAVVSYNRTTSAYAPVGLQGSTVSLRIGGFGTALKVDSTGKLTAKSTHSNGAVNEALRITTKGSYSGSHSENSGPAIAFGQFDENYPTWTTAQIAGIRKGTNWDGALSFYTNSGSSETDIVEKVRITSGGKMLMGVTSPLSSLPGIQMYLSGGDPSFIGCKADNNPGAAVTLLKLAGYSQSGASFRENAVILFETDAQNSVGSASGRILLRTENSNSTNGPTTRVRIDDEGSFYNFAENHGIYTHSSVGGGTTKYLYRAAHSSGSTIVFNVWSDGTTENTTGTIGTVSDESLKENIVDAGSQWADIKAVKFRKFNFKEETGYETHTQLGVIAQELEATSPGLIYEVTEDDGRVIKRVKSSILTNKALVALQEAMTRIETLEQRLIDAGL